MNTTISVKTICSTAVVRTALLVACSVVPIRTVIAQVPSPTDPRGVQVRVTTNQQRLTGELLAVGADSLWLLREDRTVALGKSEISAFSYRKHKFSGRKALVVGGAVSGLTTGAIALACSSYNSSVRRSQPGDPNHGDSPAQCGTATASWLGVTGGLALLTAGWASVRQWSSVPLSQWQQFNIYARFPQGLPPSYRHTP